MGLLVLLVLLVCVWSRWRRSEARCRTCHLSIPLKCDSSARIFSIVTKHRPTATDIIQRRYTQDEIRRMLYEERAKVAAVPPTAVVVGNTPPQLVVRLHRVSDCPQL